MLASGNGRRIIAVNMILTCTLFCMGCSSTINEPENNTELSQEIEFIQPTKDMYPPSAGLSAFGVSRYQAIRPVEKVLEYVAKKKISIKDYDTQTAVASSYCPPQPTVYEWSVTIHHKTESDNYLWFAVRENEDGISEVWQLNRNNLQRLGI